MPFADTPLRDEYAAAVERVAGRTLDALRGAGGAVALAPDPPEAAAAPRSLLAALRVVGPDLFAPQLLAGADPDETTALLLAEAHRVFPPAGVTGAEGDGDGNAVVTAWRDWAAGVLLVRALGTAGDTGPGERFVTAPALTPPAVRAPAPAVPGHTAWPEPQQWQPWSIRMAQLSALALPGLDGAVHRQARTHALALARGAVRSMLRRDHRAAARLTRWLAWCRAEGVAVPLELEPLLARLRVVSDGSARIALELAIATALLDGTEEPA
ncbi:hypothetical protein ACIBCA_08225 [Kitasatospora sp. NPDC051170]|uniref:hypothetical protein n=1 Tax=Kitasatospora sp. NPDC051170 TaxID=3364056 RepID=UPI0037985494